MYCSEIAIIRLYTSFLKRARFSNSEIDSGSAIRIRADDGTRHLLWLTKLEGTLTYLLLLDCRSFPNV